MDLKQIFCLFIFISVCWSKETTIDLVPENYDVFLGECVTFICNVSSIQYGNSTTLYMSLNETRFPDDQYEIVDEQTMKFNRCITDLNQAGMYYCKQDVIENGKKTNVIFYGAYIHIEKPLVPIPKDSIHCFVHNWLSMNCTWSLGEKYIKEDKIKVNFTGILAMSVIGCPNLLQTSCRWNKRDISFSIPFTFNLTVFHQNRPDKKLVTTYNVSREKPVKPSKVKFLSQSTNSSCFAIKWRHRYFYKVQFRVTYSSKVEGKKSVNTTGRDQKITICSLLPGEKYEVGISAFPKYKNKTSVGNWSDPLILNVFTKLTYPSPPPSLTNNSFMWNSNRTAVILYWKCLTRRQSGAEKVWYNIEVENQTMLGESGKTLIPLPSHKHDQNCWFIQVWAENSYGRSRTSSSITICNNTMVPPLSENVEMLIVNKTHVKVMWSNTPYKKASVSSIQILAYKNCSTDLQWFAVNGNESTVVLHLPDNDSYRFGVAAENSNGSNGITWGHCYYLIKRPRKAVDKFSVEPFNDQLQIYWQPYNCEDEKAYITGYKIKYCIALNSSKCQESEKVKNVPKTLRKFRTSQLSPGEYRVWIEAIPYAGSGPSSVKRMVRIPDFSWGVGKIIGISVAGIIVLIFIFLGCRHFQKKVAFQIDKCNPPCDVPTITDTSEAYRENKSKRNASGYSGDKVSPSSSLNTEITQLSTNSLNATYGSSDGLHPYVKISQDSLDSPISSKHGSKILKPSPESTMVQNANNNAFTTDIGLSDYQPFDQLSRESEQSKSSSNSLDKLLVHNDGQKEAEVNYMFLGSNGSLNAFCSQFAENPAVADVQDRRSPDSGNIEENSSFSDYVQNIPSSEHVSGENSVDTLNPSKTLPEEYVPPCELNKDSQKSRTNESFLPENCDILTNSSGKESGNDSMSDEIGADCYVQVDDIQAVEKDIKMNDIWGQKTGLKQIDGGEIDDGYVLEVPV